jgi:hypothetical protein
MLGKRPPTRCETAEAVVFEQTPDSESELGLDFCDSPGGLRKAHRRRNLLISNPPFPDKTTRQPSQTWVSALPPAVPTPTLGPLTVNPPAPTHKFSASNSPQPQTLVIPYSGTPLTPEPYVTTFMNEGYYYSGPLNPSGLPHGYGKLYPPICPT